MATGPVVRRCSVRLGACSGPLITLFALLATGGASLWVAPLAASAPAPRIGWTPSALTLLTELRSATFDDLDADGVLDLVLTTDEHQACFANDGHGAFAPSACQLLAEPRVIHCGAFAVGDVDADRLPDLAIGTAGCESVALLVARARGGFGLVDVFPLGVQVVGLQLADVNADGLIDLAIASAGTEPTLVLYNSGPGRLSLVNAGATSQAQ